MNKAKQLLGLFFVAAIFLVSCSGKGPAYTRYISKDAAYVMAFDTKSMMTKLAQDSLTVENMLDVLKEEESQSDYLQALEMWKQFKDAGLDFESRVFVAIPALDVEKGNATIQVLAGLKDAAKLEAFIAKLPDAPKVTKDGNLSMVNTPDFSMGWDKETVMIMARGDAADYGMLNQDSAMAVMPGAELSLGAEVKKHFALKKEESVNSIKVFTKLMDEPGDVAIFTNSSSMAGGTANPVMAFMPKVKELLNGIYSTTIINFEDGKMVMTSHTYSGDKLGALLKKYAGPVVDLSMIERYPSANLQGITAFSFKPALIPEFMKEIGLDALVNLALAEGGSNMDEVAKAIKGDFAVLFSDFGMKKMDMGKDASYSDWMPTGKLVVAARIGDKAAFDKLLGLLEKQKMVRREGSRIIPVENGVDVQSGVFAGVENDLLIFATDSAAYYGYAAGKTSTPLPAHVKSALQNQAMGFYADVESMLKAVPADLFDSAQVHEARILARSKEVFRHMWFNTGNFDGKQISSTGEVVMASGKNSLPQLVRYLMFVAEEAKAMDKADEEMAKKEMELQVPEVE